MSIKGKNTAIEKLKVLVKEAKDLPFPASVHRLSILAVQGNAIVSTPEGMFNDDGTKK